MRTLVTGGAGFIGSHVARELVAMGHNVTVLDDLSGGFIENIPAGANFIHGDITNPALVDVLFQMNKFDYVFHLAAYAAEGLSHFIRHFNYNNNLIGSINLINASVNTGVKCFVFTSSIAVYGSSPQLPMTEEMHPVPEDPYGVAKLAVEMDLEAAHGLLGLDYIIFRPHNVYGPGQNIGDRYRNVVGIFMNQVLKGEPMTVFGTGEQTRAFSYIDDVAPLIAHSIENSTAYNQVFNIGADTPYTVIDLASSISDAMDTVPNIKFLPARNEVLDAYSSHEKLQRVFGSREATSLEDGLAKMADWVREHGSRESSKFGNIEVTKNFPKAWSL
jgi:UDP-glucose 4-epimerase